MWVLIIAVALSLISIFGLPPIALEKGVLITSVESNSTAFDQGLRKGQVITSIDGKTVESVEDFLDVIKEKFPSQIDVKTIIQTKDDQVILFSSQAPQITVSDIPKTNVKTGLDLSGGARALIQAEDKKLSSEEISDLVDITNNRFNVYGIEGILHLF